MISLRDHADEMAGTDEQVMRYWVVIVEPRCVPDKKVPIPQTYDGAIAFLREVIANRPPGTRFVLCQLTWNHDLWVEDGHQAVEIFDSLAPRRGRKAARIQS